MSIKGTGVSALSGLAAMSPFRGLAETLLKSVGHQFPSRIVQSFARHFGGRLMQREGKSFERVATFASGGQMRCGADGQIGMFCLMHYFLGTITGQIEDERPIVRLLDRLLREGDVFFDVGANLGFYSLYAGPVCGASGTVHAFEANPTLIPSLERSISLNLTRSRIRLNAVAVGRHSNTQMRLYDPERIGNSSFHLHGWLNRASWIDVPVISLEDYVMAHKILRIDVVKIDIEGAELEAIRGMGRIFDVCPPQAIVCELMPSLVSSRAPTAARPAEIAEFLHQRGYIMCRVSVSDGRLRLPETSIDLIESATHVVNVVFVPPGLTKERPDLFVYDEAVSR